jgi:hemoglobin-like flavoprotein
MVGRETWRMTPAEKEIVQRTFEKLVPIADQAAALFYGRLFEMDPSLRPLFKTDLRVQGQKLMQMIAFCVKGLDAPDDLVPAVQGLGRRHAGYGVTDAHYDTVAGALLWTLEKGLGPDFTPDVKAAWTSVYVLLATTMKAAKPAVN